jgi:hypothetical protein
VVSLPAVIPVFFAASLLALQPAPTQVAPEHAVPLAGAPSHAPGMGEAGRHAPPEPWTPHGPFTPSAATLLPPLGPGGPVGGRPDDAGQGDPLRLAGRSLVLPGWGQYAAGRRHWWVYTGLDVVAWSAVVHQRREGVRFRRSYRDLAWEAARTRVWDGPRTDGPWGYYERMGTWGASGRFDRTPGQGELRPETDEGTFNGMIWRLAREIHLPFGAGEGEPGSPGYERALEYYQERAIPPELAWDWAGDEAALSRFRELIRESDRAFRTGTTFLGLALVNRFISGAEMWVAAHPGPLETIPLRLESRVEPASQTAGWQLRFRLRRHPGPG